MKLKIVEKGRREKRMTFFFKAGVIFSEPSTPFGLHTQNQIFFPLEQVNDISIPKGA